MRDVDVPVLSPSPHVISHLISSWTDVFSSSVCQYTTTLTERITVTHADSSPSKRARERDWWIVEIAEVLATIVLSTEDQTLTWRSLYLCSSTQEKQMLCSKPKGPFTQNTFCIPLQCFFKYALDDHLWWKQWKSSAVECKHVRCRATEWKKYKVLRHVELLDVRQTF